MRVPFATGAYRSRSLPLSAQRLINAQVQRTPAELKSPAPVFRTPGIKARVTVGNGAIRGAILAGDDLIVVSGTMAYRVTDGSTVTALGDIPGADVVSLATNGVKTVCVADGAGYVIEDGGLAQITDADFRRPQQVVWVDGYFVFLGDDAVFASDLGDPTSYDPLAYDYPSGSPGKVMAILVEKRDLLHFKPDAVEVWYNKGTTPYAFGRAPDGFISIGCAARRSPAALDNSVFWLASDLTVRVLRGATPERVSTEVIEQAISTYSRVDDAYGMAISHDGRFSYVLTFPAAGVTWEFNVATREWNERASDGLTYWRAKGAVAAWNKVLVWDENLVGELDPLTYTEWGDALRVTMTSTPLAAGTAQAFHDRLEIQCETGVGLLSGQGSNPQLMLRYSDDSRTWSPEFWRSIGAQGAYRKRVVWTRLGRSRGRVYELAYSDPTPFVFYSAFLNEDESLVA